MQLEDRHFRIAPPQQEMLHELDGESLDLETYGRCVTGDLRVTMTTDSARLERVSRSEATVKQAVENRESIYGVTTGFGGMAGDAVPAEFASALQNNLLNFLSTGIGKPLESHHVRGAMLLRANMLLRGNSGIRIELIERLIRFVQLNANPVVCEHGSIGASGDLVPLATIARAVTGHRNSVKVDFDGEVLSSDQALQRMSFQTLELEAKEALALVNGTSFSSAIAANTLHEFKQLFALTLGVQGMFLRSLLVHEEPFTAFVQDCKPHPGQIWVAKTMLALLRHGAAPIERKGQPVQDRYSVRCLPQYLGPNAEGLVRLIQTVEVEMNSISDNPLVDVDNSCLVQSGNFLGQYIGVGMDDLRRLVGLTAKHLDVQIANLVAPEFSGGLSPSLRGNDQNPLNMGLKGLQIAGNSIVPMLLHKSAPLVEHYPTYAEQFNQNVNGLSWGSANLAWDSVNLFGDYLSVALLFAVQACDLRASQLFGSYDGRRLLGTKLEPLYTEVLRALDCEPGDATPYLFDDSDRCLENDISAVSTAVKSWGPLRNAIQPIVQSFERDLERPTSI